MKQRIALVFPPSTFLIDPMVYPPLGLWYLAAQLESLGHSTDFYDLSVDEMPLPGEFDQIWVSATSAQMHEVRKLGKLLTEYENTPTVLGGSAVWANPNPQKLEGFGLLVGGECDHPDVIQQIFDSQATGLRVLNAGVQSQMDHVIPPIRRWAHKYKAYLADRDGAQIPCTTMFTSRGCPMACAFCESGRNGIIWDRIVRYEPWESVEAQLDEIVQQGFGAIQFYDDILPINPKRMQHVMNALKERNLIWRCFIRTDIVTKQGGYDYLRQMRDAGLVEVLAGIESADNRIKDNIMKGTTIEQDTQVMTWCQELGIQFKASFILGLPGETMESMTKTREWILTHRPDKVDVNTLIPFPGTPLTNPELVGLYDVSWDEEVPEEYWYKGPRDRTLALTRTSALTHEEISAFHEKLIQDIMELGIPY